MADYLFSVINVFGHNKKTTRPRDGVLIGVIRKIAGTKWLFQNFEKVTGSALSDYSHFLDKPY